MDEKLAQAIGDYYQDPEAGKAVAAMIERMNDKGGKLPQRNAKHRDKLLIGVQIEEQLKREEAAAAAARNAKDEMVL